MTPEEQEERNAARLLDRELARRRKLGSRNTDVARILIQLAQLVRLFKEEVEATLKEERAPSKKKKKTKR